MRLLTYYTDVMGADPDATINELREALMRHRDPDTEIGAFLKLLVLENMITGDADEAYTAAYLAFHHAQRVDVRLQDREGQ